MTARALLPFALLLALAGCNGPAPSGQGTGGEQSASGQAQTSSFKVALLTPGPVSDAGWSAMAYEGLKQIEREMGAQVSNQEAGGTKIRDAMRSYAQDGYQLVFGHGYEYNEPAVQVAKDFPKTVFVSSSGGQTAPNVGAFRFYLEQGFYLAGQMAGRMTKSGKVAMIGGDDVPSIRSTFKGFRAGVNDANSRAEVIEIFTGSGQDVAAARRATLSAIDRGADFVIHQANAAAQGVFNACKERGVYAFGANLDQNDNESGAVIGSAVIIAGPAFLDLAKRVREGRYQGEVTLMGMNKGAIDFVVNPAMKGKVPPEVMQALDATKKKILDGSLSVPKDEF